MGLRLPGKSLAKQILRRSVSSATTVVDVPKGHFAVYVGENQKRFVVPLSILNHPSFQDLLSRAEEEFGFAYQKGGLTIPCDEDTFIHLTCKLNHEERNQRHTNVNVVVRLLRADSTL